MLEWESFFSLRPNIKKKYLSSLSFIEYSANLLNSSKTNENNIFLKNIISNEINRFFSKSTAHFEMIESLDLPILSNSDHHGLLNYNLLYNSNILFSQILKDKFKAMVIFATGSVPLNNISHPRGFYFKKTKYNFFSMSKSKRPVFVHDEKICINHDNEKCISSFLSSFDKDSINNEEKKFLDYLFYDCLDIEEVSKNYNRFSDQISILNYRLWKYFFDNDIRKKIPNIIYLQSNSLLNEIFIDQINDENSLINKILFDRNIRNTYLKNFSGIDGCWGKNSGSVFFWNISKNLNVKQLEYLENINSLGNKDFIIKLEKREIIEALKTKKIILTLFFDFLIITFLCGYTALGGFNQIEYLPQMQQAHVKSLREIGINDLADEFSTRITDGLICGMTPLPWDSAIDMIWHFNSTNGKFNGNLDRGLNQEDLDRINNMSLHDMIHSAVETMAGIVK